MKRSMKKLVVFVMMVAIAIFTTAMASAKNYMKGGIQGDYFYTGESTCLMGERNKVAFDGYGFAIGNWSTSSTRTRGVWTFNLDGTGSRYGFGLTIQIRGPYAWYYKTYFETSFTYTIAPDGSIIVNASGSPAVTGHYETGQWPHTATFTIDTQAEISGVYSIESNSMLLATSDNIISRSTVTPPLPELTYWLERTCNDVWHLTTSAK